METTRTVRITVRGRLSERLAAAFDGMTLERRSRATELVGPVVDGAQLHGLLTRVRDLGLALESVRVADDAHPARPGEQARRAARPFSPTPTSSDQQRKGAQS